MGINCIPLNESTMEKLKIGRTQLGQKFRLVQIESICITQIIWLSKSEIFFSKHYGKDLMLVNSIISFFHYVINAIIFSDKSATMDFIFRDLRPFSGTDPPIFLFPIIGRSLYSAMRKPIGANSKKILLIDG